MIITVASGKGGTGKTTLAVNLAAVMENPVVLLDCDVEEPNAQLFLNGASNQEEDLVHLLIPEVDATHCTGCGECAQFCRYGAIAVPRATAIVFPELCHGCGGCKLVCPSGAICEVERRIGKIETFTRNGIILHEGRLDIGVAMAPPLIRALKTRIRKDYTVIIDAPPGTSCPVIAALRGSDFAVLVTEPTPFGLHDLKLAVEAVRELELPFGVVVNRMGIGDERVHTFCQEEKIPILAEIPDDRNIAEAYSRGALLSEALPEYRPIFSNLLKRILQNGTFGKAEDSEKP
ncbi:MAG: P-loop NTPase [Deltaproteobacteria bacterium]|nr:P-loop NTPase [Deltaproteobacteria bacterium]